MAAESFAERLWEGIDEAVEPYDISAEFGEILKSDLKAAFDIKAKPRPGYEPGAVAFVGFNLIDAITNPPKTLGKVVSSFRGELGRPPIPLAWTDAEDAVWEHYFTTAGFDPRGGPTVPLSLQQATLRWNERARVRITRLIAEKKGIQQSPGLTLMMARRLNMYYASLPGAPPPLVAGVMLPQIVAGAENFERDIAHCLAIGDWAGADEVQTKWFKASRTYRDEVRKEFERVSRLGEAGISSAAQQLATSPEGAFWRYWKNRNLYFLTLNFLNTYREGGFWGVVKVYVWMEAVKRIFGLKPEAGAPAWAVLRYYSYPKNLISGAVGWTAERVRLTAALTRLTDWRQRLKNWWKRKVKDRLKGALDWIRERVAKKAIKALITQVNRLLTKLGLKALMAKLGALIGGAIGTAAPGIGNAIAAVVGGVLSFIGGIVAEKMMKPVLKGMLYFSLGACGCLALAMGGLVMFITMVVGSIFAPGAGGPGPGPGPGPIPLAEVEVVKEVCPVDEFGQVLENMCSSWWGVPNPTILPLTVEWRVYVKNNTTDPVDIMVMDERCYPSTGSKSLTVEGGKREFAFSCREQFLVGTEDTMFTNATEGTAPLGVTVEWGTATLVIGEAPACTVAGVPYYCQCGQAYSDEKCKGIEKTVCEWGCGPASEAMLINYHCGGAVTDPGEIAREYGCGAISRGATADILGGGLSTGSFGSGDDFFSKISSQLCAGRPVITTISHPELNSGHISLIVGVDMARRKIILNDSYVSCVLPGGGGAYDEYDFDEYRGWVNTNTYWYWGGALHPTCSQ